MATITNKEIIEKLEMEIHELKEGIEKLGTKSQSNFRELKELFSKSLEKGESFGTKDQGSFQGHGDHSTRHSNGSKGSNGYTKLDFPRYSVDDPTVWINRVIQYFDYK